MNKFLVILFFIFAFAFVINSYQTGGKPLPSPVPLSTDKLDSDKLWSLVQNWRVENNLQSYIKDQKLCALAKKRLLEVHSNFSHKGILDRWETGTTGFAYIGMAENLIKDYSTNRSALDAWLNSPVHLKDLKADYKYSCIATDETYAVQIFANY